MRKTTIAERDRKHHGAGEVAVNARVADSDLVVYVHLVVTPKGGGGESFAQGLGSAGTIGQISGHPASAGDTGSRDAVIALVTGALPILQIDAILDNHVFLHRPGLPR